MGRVGRGKAPTREAIDLAYLREAFAAGRMDEVVLEAAVERVLKGEPVEHNPFAGDFEIHKGALRDVVRPFPRVEMESILG